MIFAKVYTSIADKETYDHDRWDDVVRLDNYTEWFPLWEQDQLQQILNEHFQIPQPDTYALFTFFQSFIEDIYVEKSYPCERLKTWEQLWLAFVMKEKFNKTWNGEDWV